MTIAAIPVTAQKPERDERVDKIVNCSRMEPKAFADLLAGHRLRAKLGKQLQLYGGQQRSRCPKSHNDLYGIRWIDLSLGMALHTVTPFLG